MGNLAHLQALFALNGNEVLDQMLGEYAAGSQIVVICLQRIQSLLQAGGQALQLCLAEEGSLVHCLRAESQNQCQSMRISHYLQQIHTAKQSL